MNITEQIKLYTTLWRETMLIYEDWAQRHGFSYCELLVILALAEDGEVSTQKEICRQWQLPKQTVNTILKGFEQREWTVLTPSSEDRRNKEIRLTAAGKAEIDSIASALQRCEKTAWKRMGRECSDALINSTRLYNQLLREVGISEAT